MLRLLTLAAALIFWAVATQAAVPETMKLKSSSDVRYLGLFKVYTASLYTGGDPSRQQILAPAASHCLRLDYAVDLKSDVFVEAAHTILNRQHDQATISKVQDQIDLLHASYRDVNKGDVYTLCYSSETMATRLALNSETLVEIKSPEFAAIYFGIWLEKRHGIAPELLDKL